MRLVVLTTQTPHHVYFVRQIHERFPIHLVMAETRSATAPFETAHPFEQVRDDHERDVWFEGRDMRLEYIVETETFPSINSAVAITRLRQTEAEMIVVFGTGPLSEEVIACCPNGIVNLHGGDPENYRGLDTHLWATYHGDFGGLVTTLHRLSPKLDDGEIIAREPIPLANGMKLHELRQHNTEVCVSLVAEALQSFQAGGLKSVPQARKGRYYSFMPAPLKEVCVRRFERYTDNL